MFRVLHDIYKRILEEPHVDKHYRMYTKGEYFYNNVWTCEPFKTYLLNTGWILCGDFLLFSKATPVKVVHDIVKDLSEKQRVENLSHSLQPQIQNGIKDQNPVENHDGNDITMINNEDICEELISLASKISCDNFNSVSFVSYSNLFTIHEDEEYAYNDELDSSPELLCPTYGKMAALLPSHDDKDYLGTDIGEFTLVINYTDESEDEEDEERETEEEEETD